MLVPELDLERQVIALVERVKADHPEWPDPSTLAARLGLKVIDASLGPRREAATLESIIFLTPGAGTLGRDLFTFYHEIAHALLRRADELISILHDQCQQQDDFERIIERLSNVAAAEFVIPRRVVIEECLKRGISVRLIQPLRDATGASATAVCIQLGLTAPHRCVALVACWKQTHPPSQVRLLPGGGLRLLVEFGISSRTMQYTVARNAAIPAGHLLHRAAKAAEGEVIEGKDRLPFRSGTIWVAECEALRLGSRVFALAHVDPKPISDSRQIELIPEDAAGRLGVLRRVLLRRPHGL